MAQAPVVPDSAPHGAGTRGPRLARRPVCRPAPLIRIGAPTRRMSRSNRTLSPLAAPSLPAKLAYLADPRHHTPRPRSVECIETHYAWVFLVGSYALKLKKPMRQTSMDYRTLADRERACRTELQLNRRLAPSVYLGVTALKQTRSGRLSLRSGTRIVDWLVRMRRLAPQRSLERTLLRRGVTERDWARLAATLATFFARAERRPMSEAAYLARLQRQTARASRELCAADLGLDARRVAALTKVQRQFLSAHGALLHGRAAQLRDGHGDLRPEHVFLDSRASRLCVIDCLEFDADLRRLDPLEEIAFLALECARLAGARSASHLIAHYRRFSADCPPAALIDFYMSRRAAVRAQISAWHLRDPAFALERPAWRARAESYLGDALRLGRRALSRAGRSAARARGAARRVTPRGAPATARAAVPPERRSPSAARPGRAAARPTA